MKTTDQAVVVQQNFKVEIDALWRAITEVNQMTQWFFENIEAFEPKVGFQTSFIVENEGRTFPHLWEIIEVVPCQKISYNWKYENYSGDSVVTFLLLKHENYTQLKLTHQVTKNFTEDIPEFKRESCLAGWNWFIKQRLKAYLVRFKK